jgi:hypothetical protein
MLKLYGGTAKNYTKVKTEKVSRPFKPDADSTLSEQVMTWHREVERINAARAEAKEKKDRSRKRNGGGLRRELIALGITFDEQGNAVVPMM